MDHLLNLIKQTRLNLQEAFIHPGSGEFGSHNLFPINPKEFLRYSKQDLKEGGDRGLINALTNAKRAIDCQIDEVFKAFKIEIYKGENQAIESFLSHFDLAEKSYFKLKLIEALNLAPSLIIAQTREIRHKLEHYYEIPDLVDVKRAHDIASLFISSIQGKFRGFYTQFEISNKSASDLENDDLENGDHSPIIWFNLIMYTGKFTFGTSYQGELSNEIDSKHELFYGLLRLMFSIDDEDELNESFRVVLKQMKHPMPTSKARLVNVYS